MHLVFIPKAYAQFSVCCHKSSCLAFANSVTDTALNSLHVVSQMMLTNFWEAPLSAFLQMKLQLGRLKNLPDKQMVELEFQALTYKLTYLGSHYHSFSLFV